jgi:inorganic pyrophosphatase
MKTPADGGERPVVNKAEKCSAKRFAAFRPNKPVRLDALRQETYHPHQFSQGISAMRVDQIPVGKNAPDDVNVIIEVPIGGEPIKYELDKASGALVVDRFLYTAMRYPGNYGFIPHTLSGDGDPVDVLVANSRAIAPGAVMSVRPVGVLLMEDNAGMDEKIVAVPSYHITQRFDGVTNFSDLPDITVKQIEHFFAHYKDLEPGKWVKIIRWGDATEAKKMIDEGVERAKKA